MVMAINYSTPHTTLRGQVFELVWVYQGVIDLHICALAFRLCFVLFCYVCLCVNETAGSRLNKRFPGAPIHALLCLPCLPALFVSQLCLYGRPWQKYACLTTKSSGHVCHMRWILAPPLFVFCTLLLVFFFFAPAPRCNSREEGVDACEAGGVTVPPQME